jgi:hypothetical protein
MILRQLPRDFQIEFRGHALQLSHRSRISPDWHLAGLLTCASSRIGSPSQGQNTPVASSKVPISQRSQLRGSGGIAPPSRTPDALKDTLWQDRRSMDTEWMGREINLQLRLDEISERHGLQTADDSTEVRLGRVDASQWACTATVAIGRIDFHRSSRKACR